MHPQDSSCTFCSWNSRLSSATTGTLITVQPNAGSKKKKKQPAQVTQSVPPTGNPTNMDGIMWVGSLMFVLSIIALYFLPGDEQLSALSYLYEYFTWPLFGAIAILIGVFIQGVRTSDWNLFFGIGLVNFLVVLLYGIIKGLIFLILNHFWPLIGVIAIVILIGAIILGFSTGDWDLFRVIGVVYLLAAVLYGLYYLYVHHFWPLVGVIAIAILIGVIIQKRISTV